MPERATSDEFLMQAAGRGDLGAFEEIVRRHQAWAWRVAYRFLGHEEDAADAVQDAFLRLLDAGSRYRPAASFRTYLYQVVSRVCLDRAKKKRPLYVKEVPEIPDPCPDADETMVRDETAAAVRVALDALPPRQRMAVVLKYYEGLSYTDIADAMGITVKAAERLLANARKSLQSSLARLKGD